MSDHTWEGDGEILHFTIDAGAVLGMLGVGFCFASFAMKRMLSLRVLALVSNVCFVSYGVVEWLLPHMRHATFRKGEAAEIRATPSVQVLP